jgi:hypothetical protein
MPSDSREVLGNLRGERGRAAEVNNEGEDMALKNPNLQKVGNQFAAPNSNGHSQLQLVQPAVALTDPDAFDGTSGWHSKRIQFLQSVQVTQKFSQDWE